MKKEREDMEMRIQWGMNISEIKAQTKKKNAYIKVDLPSDFANMLLKQIGSQKNYPIYNLKLIWEQDK